jgi:hypothetical protein
MIKVQCTKACIAGKRWKEGDVGMISDELFEVDQLSKRQHFEKVMTGAEEDIEKLLYEHGVPDAAIEAVWNKARARTPSRKLSVLRDYIEKKKKAEQLESKKEPAEEAEE